MTTEDVSPDRPRARAVALRVGDPTLAGRLGDMLADLPGVDLVEEDEAEIVIADEVPGEPAEAGLIVLAAEADTLRALRAGAEAVLTRAASGDELRLAIDAVARGYALAPIEALDALVRRDEGEAGFTAEAPPTLTRREGEVLALIAEGASNKAIARRLAISVHTAKFHVASILDKLDAAGRTDAVARAVRLGLLML